MNERTEVRPHNQYHHTSATNIQSREAFAEYVEYILSFADKLEEGLTLIYKDDGYISISHKYDDQYYSFRKLAYEREGKYE